MDSTPIQLAGSPAASTGLRLSQIAWWLVGFLVAGLFLLLIPLNYRATLVSEEVERSAALLIPRIPIHTYTAYLVTLRYLAAAIFFSTSIVIYWRRRDDWVAVFVAITLLLLSLSFNFVGNVEIISPTNAIGNLFREITGYLLLSPLILITFLGYIFPDGRFIPQWTRWIVIFGLVFSVVDVGISIYQEVPEDADWDLVANWGLGLLALTMFSLIITSIYSQIYRYRRVSTPVQRQQTKLVLFGILLYLQWIAGPWWWALKDAEAPLGVLVRLHLDILFPIFLPLTIGLSILRFRLWDIDVLIRRTLIYGALTGTLALVYLFSVILLQRFFPSQSQLATVFSTLIIAALFNPLRRRIQNDIDRRFFRKKYDAEITLAAFGTTLQEEVDLDQLSLSLVEVVIETLQPEVISLWLKERSAKTGHR